MAAQQAALGTDLDEDVGSSASDTTFQLGFGAWGNALEKAGWGTFELVMCDRAACRAIVVVRSPWEFKLQQGLESRWGCPFIAGKLTRIFSRAFGVNCRVDEVSRAGDDGSLSVEFHVYRSGTTIAEELDALRMRRREEDDLALREVNRALVEHVDVVHRQEDVIRAMHAPILKVWKGVLAVPIVGPFDDQRRTEIIQNLLSAIAQSRESRESRESRARYAILDLTGVDAIDGTTAAHVTRISRAVALLGAECVVCGIQPAVAAAMSQTVRDGEKVRTFATMESALMVVIGEAAAPSSSPRATNA